MNVASAGLLFLALLSPLAAIAGAGITYHGRILSPSGAPVSSASVQFRFQVRTPGSENCLLYEELQTKNMSQSNGFFALTMNDGSGARTDPGAYSIDRIFQNRGVFSLFGLCAIGSTFTPNPGDGRKIVVEFNDGSGWEPMPAQLVNYVPLSIESMSVGGYQAGNLLRVEDGGIPQTVSSLSSTQLNALLAVANTGNVPGNAATSTTAVTSTNFTGALAGDVTGTQGATSVVRLQGRDVSATAPANGEVLKWNGTAWAPAVDGGAGGGVTAVSASAPLASSGGATPDISLTAGSTAGQTLRWGGAAWSAAKLNYQDLVNNVAASPWPGASCTSGQFLTWSSVSDNFACTAVSGAMVNTALGYTPLNPANNLSDVANAATARTNLGLGTAAIKNFGTAAGQLVELDGGAKIPASLLPSLVAADIPNLDWSKITTGKPTTLSGYGITDSVQNAGATPSVQSGLDASKPAAGTAGRLYVATDTRVIYRDTGATWESLGGSGDFLANGSVAMTGNLRLNNNWLSNDGGNEGIRIDNSGNVGIGTASPSNLFHVAQDQNALTTTRISNWDTGTSAAAQLRIDGDQNSLILRQNSLAYTASGQQKSDGAVVQAEGNGGLSISSSNPAGQIRFYTAGTTDAEQRMTILSGGNVGIGTTNPGEMLSIVDSTAYGSPSWKQYVSVTGASDNYPGFRATAFGGTTNYEHSEYHGFRARGAFGSPTATLSGDYLVSYNGRGYNSTLAGYSGGAIIFEQSGAATATGNPTDILFRTNDGTNQYGTERVRIAASGNVGIGTTNPQSLLHVNGVIRATDICDENGANCRDISTGWGGGGTVTSVTSANADIGVATTTSTPVLTLNSGTGANQILKLNASSEIPAVSGVNLTALNASNLGSGTVPAARMPALTGDATMTAGTTATTVARIQGRNVAATAPLDGQVYRWNNGATQWEPVYFGVDDLRTSAGASQFSASCTASQTLTWSAVTDAFTCSNIAGLDAAVITTGTIAAARLPASASFWETATGGINYAGGNVGIGLTNPGHSLEILKDGSSANVAARSYSNSNNTGGIFLSFHARGSASSPTHNLTGDRLGGHWAASAYNYAGWSGFNFTATENHTDTAQGTSLNFYTVPNGTLTTQHAMTIGHNGNVSIGTTDSNNRLRVHTSTQATTIDSGNLVVTAGGTSSHLALGARSGSSWIQANTGYGGTVSANDLILQGFGGRVGIGTDNPGTLLDVNETYTGTSTSFTMDEAYLIYSPATDPAPSTYARGSYFHTDTSGTANMTNASVAAAQSTANHYPATTVNLLMGLEGEAKNKAGGTVTSARGLQADVDNESTGTIGTATGIYSSVNNESSGMISTARAGYFKVDNLGAGSISTGYGIYIGSIQATTKYGVYQSDATTNNYYAGNVGIGTTSPSSSLDVNGMVSAQSLAEGTTAYVNSGASYAIPDTSLNIRRITLTANTTLTLPTFTAPANKVYNLTVFIKQDATGSRTLSIVGSGGDTIKWDGGSMPTISPTPNNITILQFIKASDESIWFGSMVWKEN